MTEELPDGLYLQIVDVCRIGDEEQANDQYDVAIEHYMQALDSVPDPFDRWEASTWILTALGETYLFKHDFEKARGALQDAMKCPNALGNPFIHLLLGMTYFELGDLKRAGEGLARAYMGGDDDIFEGEDPKYFDYLKTILKM